MTALNWTDDPDRDFTAYDAKCYRDTLTEAENRPRCEICDKTIWEDEAIYYNDQWVCTRCEKDFWNDIRYDFLKEVQF